MSQIAFSRTCTLFTQRGYLESTSKFRISEKSRQIGATKADALDSVLKASVAEALLDVWLTSRDDVQPRLYLEACLEWARITSRDKLGLLRHWPHQGTYEQFAPLDLLPQVRAVLTKHTRFSI